MLSTLSPTMSKEINERLNAYPHLVSPLVILCLLWLLGLKIIAVPPLAKAELDWILSAFSTTVDTEIYRHTCAHLVTPLAILVSSSCLVLRFSLYSRTAY